MKKLLLLLLTLNLYADILLPRESHQLLVVYTNGFENNQGFLQAFEKVSGQWRKHFDPIPVNLGRNGLAWGQGILGVEHEKDEPQKHEGDGKSPGGLFSLDLFFGYDDKNFNFPYTQVNPSTLCIDDSSSDRYNQIIQAREGEEKAFKSFEYMKRNDDLYKLGIVVGHNKNASAQKGSCIFIHIEKEKNSSTSGCTSMPEAELYGLMQWLDKKKTPLLLQVPLRYLPQEFR